MKQVLNNYIVQCVKAVDLCGLHADELLKSSYSTKKWFNKFEDMNHKKWKNSYFYYWNLKSYFPKAKKLSSIDVGGVVYDLIKINDDIHDIYSYYIERQVKRSELLMDIINFDDKGHNPFLMGLDDILPWLFEEELEDFRKDFLVKFKIEKAVRYEGAKT